MIGNFYRPGKFYTTEPVVVHDHDFPSLGSGKAVPHGLYGVRLKVRYSQLSDA
ncbi:MAG: hypothetical protein D3906_11285 [Candidatus Electrothrix sp. AUS1_2]|nr:hypothetical protein [Candidatus Electrothrix sp. AUS1_2]